MEGSAGRHTVESDSPASSSPSHLFGEPARDAHLPMRCVCGWCRTEIRSGVEPETTGICQRCADTVRREWISQQSGRRPRQPWRK